MKTYEYRIKEKAGRFYIQALYEYSTGFFKRREVSEWRCVDIFGVPLINLYAQVPLVSLPSLESAREQIKAFKKGVVMHAAEEDESNPD